MDMKQAMKERHMVRKYTDKPIPENIVEKLNERVRENNERYGLSIRLMTNDGSAVPGVIKLILAKGVNNFFIMAGPDGADELCGYCVLLLSATGRRRVFRIRQRRQSRSVHTMEKHQSGLRTALKRLY